MIDAHVQIDRMCDEYVTKTVGGDEGLEPRRDSCLALQSSYDVLLWRSGS